MSDIPNFPSKPFKVIRKEAKAKIKCSADFGCDTPVTSYTGAGTTLCRHHQLELKEWGGKGRLDRHYTLHGYPLVCVDCGYDPMADPAIMRIPDEKLRKRAADATIHSDHVDPVATGGGNDKANIEPRCANCHSIRTAVEKHHALPKKEFA